MWDTMKAFQGLFPVLQVQISAHGQCCISMGMQIRLDSMKPDSQFKTQPWRHTRTCVDHNPCGTFMHNNSTLTFVLCDALCAPQVAALLEGVSTVAGLVDNALLNGTAPAGPLEDLAAAVTAQGQAAAKQLEVVLEGLRPPPQVLEAVLRPVGQVLDPIAGDIIKGGAALPNVTNSLLTAMDRLAAVAGTVTKELGDLVSQGLFSGVSPSDVLTPPDVLLGEVVKAVGSALDEVAGNITGSVLSLPGPQQQNAATQAVQSLADTLGATQQQLVAARMAIPASGPVLSAVLGDQDALAAIQQAVSSLSSSTDLAAASSVLRQLLPAAEPAVRSAVPVVGSSSLVSAGQSMLNDFRSSIGSWVGQFQPGAVAGAFANGFQEGWVAGGAR
jgi:hypothetical protein